MYLHSLVDLSGPTCVVDEHRMTLNQLRHLVISEATYHLVRDDFDTTLRGSIEVTGEGTLTTWYLEHTRQPAPSVTL